MSNPQAELLQEVRKMNARLKLMATFQLLSGHGMPLSKYWTWYQKSAASAITVNAGQTVTLVESDQIPSDYGWLHSLDIQASSGSLVLSAILSSPRAGGQTNLTGSLLSFWLAGFNSRMPASAGDPIVVNMAVDEPAAMSAISTIPEWKTRVSPSFNVPFSTPFTFKAINPTAAAMTIYGYDIYFILLTKDFIDLVHKAEIGDLIFGEE